MEKESKILKTHAMRRKERKQKFEHEIKLELDKIFGPKRKRRPKKYRENGSNKEGLANNQNEWKKLDLTLLSKEKISNRLAKMNVYFQTSGTLNFSLNKEAI